MYNTEIIKHLLNEFGVEDTKLYLKLHIATLKKIKQLDIDQQYDLSFYTNELERLNKIKVQNGY